MTADPQVLATLCGRFPLVAENIVKEVLKQHDNHAGYAAADLRNLNKVPDADADDAEHVETLLSSPAMICSLCKEQFEKFDADGDGFLDFAEIVALTNDLHTNFGLKQQSETTLKAFIAASDKNADQKLDSSEFWHFFQSFLRHSHFDVDKLRRIVESAPKEVGGA